jgi:hypothetical protein
MSVFESAFEMPTAFSVISFSVLALLALYSFYMAQRLPAGWPDDKKDWRIVILGLCLLPICFGSGAYFLLGVPFLMAIAVGTFLGMLFQLFKAQRLRWVSRPNKLSFFQHRAADELEFAFSKLIHDVGMPYQVSRCATEEGLEKIKEAARQKAKEYYALTGHNIEMDIDRWLHRRWVAEIVEPKPSPDEPTPI